MSQFAIRHIFETPCTNHMPHRQKCGHLHNDKSVVICTKIKVWSFIHRQNFGQLPHRQNFGHLPHRQNCGHLPHRQIWKNVNFIYFSFYNSDKKTKFGVWAKLRRADAHQAGQTVLPAWLPSALCRSTKVLA